MKKHLGRRAFLGTVGAGAIALPFLRTLETRADGHFPKRFVVFFTPNGTWPDQWNPTGSETSFTFRRILEPLTPFKEKMIVISGMDMDSAYSGPGDGHQQGMGHMLTGVELLPGDTMGGCDSCAPVSWAGGISVDQAIANAIGTDTRFRSLEFGVRSSNNANVWTRMCYRGASEPLPPDNDPYRMFERVFGEITADPFGLERRRALRQSVIDFVNEDFTKLRAQLGTEDRVRFDSHIAGVREIERRLEASAGLGAACEAPMIGSRLDPMATENFPEIGRLQMDQIVMSLACDITRVASIQWTNSVGQVAFPWLGITDQHHDLSHEGDSNAGAVEKIIQINVWYAQQFAYLCQRMSEIPEGDGSLLDHTCILWCNELGKGNSHTRRDMPILLAGSAGGALRTGRWLQMPETPHNDLLVTLCNAYGIERTTFGDDRFCNGPLTTLLV